MNSAIQALLCLQEFSAFLQENKFNRATHLLLTELQRLYKHSRKIADQKTATQYAQHVLNKELVNLLIENIGGYVPTYMKTAEDSLSDSYGELMKK